MILKKIFDFIIQSNLSSFKICALCIYKIISSVEFSVYLHMKMLSNKCCEACMQCYLAYMEQGKDIDLSNKECIRLLQLEFKLGLPIPQTTPNSSDTRLFNCFTGNKNNEKQNRTKLSIDVIKSLLFKLFISTCCIRLQNVLHRYFILELIKK